MTLGIIPAAGVGSRIQPLAFSKELLPVGSRLDGGVERPRAVSEYLVERLILGGATRICFVISPTKSDIIEYYGGSVEGVPICYVVQQEPAGLCDALFQALPLTQANEPVLVGLPDTVWFPEDGLRHLPDDALSFLCFPVEHPEYFDAVVSGPDGAVREICVKQKNAPSSWVWGAFKMPGRILADLASLWAERGREDAYVGTLVNAYLARGGSAVAVRAGLGYVDTGTLHGYRDAVRLLDGQARNNAPRPYRVASATAAAGGPSPSSPPPPPSASEVDARVRALGRGEPAGRIVVVCAHPDDETLFAGITLSLQPDVCLVHVTDGAPSDPWFAKQAGVASRAEYARLRDAELGLALQRIGLGRASRRSLGLVDQEVGEAIPRVVDALASVFATERPDVVLTHAYEGGHPDHDATAFAVRAALLRVRGFGLAPAVVEFSGYHAGSGPELAFGFLPRPTSTRIVRRELSPAERARKEAALACFQSQKEVIARLAWGCEELRPAGLENFARPPHDGPVHYDGHGWALDGARLRALLQRAADVLHVPSELSC